MRSLKIFLPTDKRKLHAADFTIKGFRMQIFRNADAKHSSYCSW